MCDCIQGCIYVLTPSAKAKLYGNVNSARSVVVAAGLLFTILVTGAKRKTLFQL